jgi:hypothetical protein
MGSHKFSQEHGAKHNNKYNKKRASSNFLLVFSAVIHVALRFKCIIHSVTINIFFAICFIKVGCFDTNRKVLIDITYQVKLFRIKVHTVEQRTK